MTEKTFNKYFNYGLMFCMLAVIAVATAFKLQDPGQRVVMLLLASFGTLLGVLSTILSANGLILTFLFGAIDVSIGAALALDSGLMGNFALHAFFFLPMQFVGIWQWYKRGARTKDAKVKARRLSKKGIIIILVSVAAGLALAYAVLYYIDFAKFNNGSIEVIDRHKIFWDSVVLVLNVTGQVLMSLAFFEQWIVWTFVNISSIVMWGIAMGSSETNGYTLVMLIKYCFYLINSLNGIRIWYRLSKPEALA